jgi:hypothetical protein
MPEPNSVSLACKTRREVRLGWQAVRRPRGLTRNQIGKFVNAPEMKDFGRNATMIFVFGL